MPRPIARVFQEFASAAVGSTPPVLKTVVVGPCYHEVASTPLEERIGQHIAPLMSTDGSSPTISAVSITEYPENKVGAVVVDDSVSIKASGYVEVAVDNDGEGVLYQNTVDTPGGDLSKVSSNDNVILTPTAVQLFEDLGADFIADGVTPDTDFLKIGSDIHRIVAVQSPYRLLVSPTGGAPANIGFFAAADGSANISYSIGANFPDFNDSSTGTTGRRRTWRKVITFKDANADFNEAGVVVGHYLKIGGSIHEIAGVLDKNHLFVKDGVSVTSPQTHSEFANNDSSANVAYSIGSASGNFKNVLDYSLSGTGQRLESTSMVNSIFSVATNSFILQQFLPFNGTTAAPINFRIEHFISEMDVTGISVNPTTKEITIPSNRTTTYAGGSVKIIDAALYLSYRSLRQDLSSEIDEYTASNVSDLGQNTSNNPLGRAVRIAIANAGGARINALGIRTDDSAGYSTALDILANDPDVFCIVPLTQDVSILQSFKSHVAALSVPDKGKRRLLICQPGQLPTFKTVTSAKTDGTAESGTVLFSPTASFGADNVTPGDTLVLSSPTTNTYTINAVLSGNRISITGGTFTGGEQAATGAVAFTIRRSLTMNGQVQELKTVPQSFNERRAVCVWPDVCKVENDENQPGFYLAAAAGGQVASLPSHRMTTKIGLAGIQGISNSNKYFSDDQINELIDAGYYMIEQLSANSSPFCSQQHTSVGNAASPAHKYLSSVKNFDFIANQYQAVINAFPANWNVIPSLFESVYASIEAVSTRLIDERLPQIGAPLVSATAPVVQPSPTQTDKVVAYLRVKIPNVLNELDMYIISE